MSLLLFFAGASTARPALGVPPAVHKGPGKRHRREVLEELLRQQSESGPFTRKRFNELLAKAEQAAQAATNKVQRKAIKAAIAEVELLPEHVPDLAPLIAAMEEMLAAVRVKKAIDAAKHAEAIARAYLEELERDEEEAIALLF